jgi:hypothetical protein
MYLSKESLENVMGLVDVSEARHVGLATNV